MNHEEAKSMAQKRRGKVGKKKIEVDLSKRRTLTLSEVEEYYGIASETLKKWIRRNPADGVPPLGCFKPGRDIMIFRDVLEEYIRMFPVSA